MDVSRDKANWRRLRERVIDSLGPLATIRGIEETIVSPQRAREILALPREELSYGEYDLLLLCEPTPTALYYLPWALAHIQEMREEYGEVACKAARAIQYETHWLKRYGLYDDVLVELQAAFWIWLDRCEIRQDWESGAFPLSHTYLLGGQERNDFLAELQDTRLMVENEVLIDRLLGCLVEPSNVKWSVHLVDMLFLEEDPIVSSELHRNAIFRELMGNPAAVREHWRFAADYVRSLAPGAYFQSREAFVERLGR